MRLKLLSIAVVAALGAGHASADAIGDAMKLNKKLHGKYSLQQTETCTSSAAGFGPAPGYQALGPTGASTGAAQSIVTYNGDGTSTLEGDTVQITHKFADPTVTVTNPITRSHYVCTGTYQVNADDTFTTDYSCTGNLLAGVAPGLAFTLVGGHSNGLIVNKKTTHSMQDTISVETISTIYGSTPRICMHSGTATKLKDNDD